MNKGSLDASQAVQLIMQMNTQSSDEEVLKEVQELINQMKNDPQNYHLSLQLMSTSSDLKVCWFAVNILEHLITMYWVPHSLDPDPTASVFTEEIKQQIRSFLLSYITGPITQLDESNSNLVLKLISLSMKVDFQHEGIFWIQNFGENITNYNYIFYFLRIFQYFAEDLHAFDHVVSSKTSAETKTAFYNIIPDICESTVQILTDSNATQEIIIQVFLMIDSFMSCTNPAFYAQIPGIISIYINFSSSEQPLAVACAAHKCLNTLFGRVNLITLFEVEDRQQILGATLSFFENELSTTDLSQSDHKFVSTLLVAFQPLAGKYLFRSDMFEDDAVNEFLFNFEDLTWSCFGTDNFHPMIEFWIDFSHGTVGRTSVFVDPFIRLVKHIVEMMIDDEQYQYITDEDSKNINELINDLFNLFPNEIYQIFQRATSTAINNRLGSAEFLLSCFIHMIDILSDDDPHVAMISDSFIRYMNELMTHRMDENIQKTFELFILTKTIIENYVRKFSRMDRFFLEKVLHLLRVAIATSQEFINSMLELLLETLKIIRPLKSAELVLQQLISRHEDFLNLSPENYLLYMCCLITVSASPPTDAQNTPLVQDPNAISEMFAVTFSSLLDPLKCPIALKIMKHSLNCIILTERTSKDLVYAAFAPNIDLILTIYEKGCPENIMQPLFDYLYVFITAFNAQIGDSIGEIIARLFAPLEGSLSNMMNGTIEQIAATSFLQLLFRIAQFRTSITAAQTENIVNLIDRFGLEFLGSNCELLLPTINIISALIEDRWAVISPENGNRLLRFLFFEGLNNHYPDAVKSAIKTITTAQTMMRILDTIEDGFIYNAFTELCTEMCTNRHTTLRDCILEFMSMLYEQVPDFIEKIIFPYIRSLNVLESDQEVLAQHFQMLENRGDFSREFSAFCTDVAYLTMGTQDYPENH